MHNTSIIHTFSYLPIIDLSNVNLAEEEEKEEKK